MLLAFFFPPFIPERYFLPDIEFVVYNSFLSVLMKGCAIYFWPPYFQIRNLLSLQLVFPSSHFKDYFFFSLIFSSLMGYVLVWIPMGSSHLKLVLLFEDVGLCLSPSTSGKCLSIVSLKLFEPHIFPFLEP